MLVSIDIIKLIINLIFVIVINYYPCSSQDCVLRPEIYSARSWTWDTNSY